MGCRENRSTRMREAERLAIELLSAVKSGDIYNAMSISNKLTSLLNTYKVSC